MAAALTLRSVHAPGAGGSAGTVTLHLTASGVSLAPGWRLAFTSITQLTPPDGSGVRLAARLATYHELAPEPAVELTSATPWDAGDLLANRPPRHAGDGPVSAFVVTADGAVLDVDVVPMAAGGTPPTTAPSHSVPSHSVPSHRATSHPAPADDRPPLVPFPADLAVVGSAEPTHHSARFAGGPPAARDAWTAVRALEQRLGRGPTLRTDGDLEVVALADRELPEGGYRLAIDAGRVEVRAGDEAGFRHALTTLAQWLAAGVPARAHVSDRPAYTWRGLHLDVARRWFDPAVVGALIDLAAWRKLDRLHLHLTDDEGWRLPVERFPELATVGGRRGHGLALPPMLGDGPGPTGRAYEPGEIAAWLQRADRLGVVVVPEVDLPAHAHAALTAVPALRDPDDRSNAASVQDFVDNVLVPGLPVTDALLDAVVDALTASFPTSPWIHVGGDEVPDGAWRGSPVVDRFRVRQGLGSTRDVEAAFHRDLVTRLSAAGRRVGAWQEAAESGGVRPGDGYVVGWRTARDARLLAEQGHDVVVSPGSAYYLDMALDDEWSSVGASWAGSVPLERVCDFEPDRGWSAEARARLLGVQACVWTEHIRDVATFDHLVFPRLDAIAERAWTGRVEGGATSLARRAAAMVRLGDLADTLG